jgi:hypothetical protein
MNNSEKTKLYDGKKYTVDKNGFIRPDFLFSYWIIVWFIVYIFLDTSKSSKNKWTYWIHSHINPFFALCIALIENLLTFIYMISENVKVVTLFKYIFMMILIKILPLYYIFRYSYYRIWESILSFIVIFTIYLIYLHTQEQTVVSVYERTLTAFKSGEDNTPLFILLHYIFRLFSF